MLVFWGVGAAAGPDEPSAAAETQQTSGAWFAHADQELRPDTDRES
ncbi:MAG: hypothetical protein ACRCSF_13610 [Mycobacteriaceae bacterium]